MIVDATTALLAQLNSVAGLANNVGMSVGGAASDPTSNLMPTPGAWVVYVGKVPATAGTTMPNGMTPRGVVIRVLFSVMVFLDNSKGQNHLNTVGMPLLEEIIASVRGVTVPLGEANGFRFTFEGERLHAVTASRLSYEQIYSIIMHL